MRSFKLRYVFPLTALLFGSLWFLVGDREVSRREPQMPASQGEEHDSSLAPPSVDSGEGRESANLGDNSTLRGVVRSVTGSPVQGAHVTWLELRSEDAASTAAWTFAGWNQRDRIANATETDPSGFFEFARHKEGGHGSVLLAFHPDHYPGGMDLPEEPSAWPANPEIVLEPATPILVLVVDPSGKPQNGATVRHASLPRSTHPDDSTVQDFERFLSQEGLTGSDGRIAFSPLRGEQVLWAEKGELVSVTWQGEQPSSVVLTLGEAFTLEGTVTLDLRNDIERESGQRLLVSGLKGNLWRQLACMRGVQEGKWGPLRIPLDGVSRYRVRLEGEFIIPLEKSFERPRSSGRERIDFVASRGGELYVTALDSSKNPVPTAHAEAWWEPGLFPKVRAYGTAGPDGVIRLGALPPGPIHYKVEAPGYACEDLWEIEVVDTSRTDVTLQRAGSIAGRCLHEGAPVSDFEVIYWRVGNVSIYHNKSFLGRTEGRFEIEGLAPGDWSLHAASPEYPSGRPLTVSVEADRETEAELGLPTAIRGGGRVLDADTGEPVSGALVQPYSSGDLKRTLPWGPGVITTADGSFDLDAFALGLNYLTVEADGFALGEAEANATDTEFVDWGEIRLVRPQTLQVSLLGLAELHGIGPGDLRAFTQEGYILPEKRFDLDGIVRYDDVPPGDLRLLVYQPDGSWARLHLRLDPGKEWNFDLKVTGDRRLEVHATDSRGEALPYVPNVMVGAHEETGFLVVRMEEAVEGHASFEGIRADKVQVIVLDPDFNFVASKDVAFGSDSSKTVEMRVGEEPFRVHVVDADRAPVPGASVTVRSATGADIHGIGQCAADGWAEIVGLPSGPLLMDVQDSVVGRAFGIPIDASSKELEFVLDATGSLELELVDGDLLLAGVLTRIETTAGVTLGDARQTDDKGRVRYESLGEGNYHLASHRADCWPATVDEELAPGEQARVRVQMRRLADLKVVLLSPDGLPVSGVAVELTSDEFDVSVDEWLQEERVRAPGGLTTDLRGSIRVEGLPRGTYTWSVSGFAEPLTGTIELKVAQENRVSAFLPR